MHLLQPSPWVPRHGRIGLDFPAAGGGPQASPRYARRRLRCASPFRLYPGLVVRPLRAQRRPRATVASRSTSMVARRRRGQCALGLANGPLGMRCLWCIVPVRCQARYHGSGTSRRWVSPLHHNMLTLTRFHRGGDPSLAAFAAPWIRTVRLPMRWLGGGRSITSPIARRRSSTGQATSRQRLWPPWTLGREKWWRWAPGWAIERGKVERREFVQLFCVDCQCFS